MSSDIAQIDYILEGGVNIQSKGVQRHNLFLHDTENSSRYIYIYIYTFIYIYIYMYIYSGKVILFRLTVSFNSCSESLMQYNCSKLTSSKEL